MPGYRPLVRMTNDESTLLSLYTRTSIYNQPKKSVKLRDFRFPLLYSVFVLSFPWYFHFVSRTSVVFVSVIPSFVKLISLLVPPRSASDTRFSHCLPVRLANPFQSSRMSLFFAVYFPIIETSLMNPIVIFFIFWRFPF